MAFAENIDDFMPDFSVSCSIGPVVFLAVFDNPQADTFGIVANTASSILASTEELTIASAAVGSSIIVDSTTYTIAEMQQDGTGMTRLMLK
jgi:hypothetical protein